MTVKEVEVQRLKALEVGNVKRLAVAGWKRDMKVLPRDEALPQAIDLFANEIPYTLGCMRTIDAITGIKGFGQQKARSFLRSAMVNRPYARLDQLAASERKRIATALRGLKVKQAA